MKYFTKRLPYPSKLAMVLSTVLILFAIIGSSAIFCGASTINDTITNNGTFKKSLTSQENTLTIKLLGITSYELTEIFNDIIETTPGVSESRRCLLLLDPKRPRAGAVEWQITFYNTTPFALESAIYNRLQEITKNRSSTYSFNNFQITLNDSDYEILSAVKPLQSSRKTLCFVETNVFAYGAQTKWHFKNHRSTHYWNNYQNRGFE